MARPTIAVVRALALALPDTEERPSYGTPGFRVRDRLFARALDEDRVVVKMSLDHRDVVLVEPAIFSVTDHYRPHPGDRHARRGDTGAAR
jgi:hypothetical protein